MVDEKDILIENLKLLNEYVNDLLELQSVNFKTHEENKLIHRTVERRCTLLWKPVLTLGITSLP